MTDDFDDLDAPPDPSPAGNATTTEPSTVRMSRWEQPFEIPHAAVDFPPELPADRPSRIAAPEPADEFTPVTPRPQDNEPELASPDPSTPPRRARRRAPLVVAATLVVLVAAVAAAGLLLWPRHSHQEPTAQRPPAAASVAPTTPADPCPEEVSGTTTTGNGPGGQTSGPDVIKAWNYAYYVTRQAAAAKAVTTPGAVAEVPAIQKYIDAVPAGSTHCLTITEGVADSFRVKIAIIPPSSGQPPEVIPQIVQTVQAGGKWWIASIKPDTSSAS